MREWTHIRKMTKRYRSYSKPRLRHDRDSARRHPYNHRDSNLVKLCEQVVPRRVGIARVHVMDLAVDGRLRLYVLRVVARHGRRMVVPVAIRVRDWSHVHVQGALHRHVWMQVLMMLRMGLRVGLRLRLGLGLLPFAHVMRGVRVPIHVGLLDVPATVP